MPIEIGGYRGYRNRVRIITDLQGREIKPVVAWLAKRRVTDILAFIRIGHAVDAWHAGGIDWRPRRCWTARPQIEPVIELEILIVDAGSEGQARSGFP